MLKGTASKQYPVAPEGHYTLTLTIVKDKPQTMTPYGLKDKIALGFEVVGTNDGAGNPIMVWLDLYASLGKQSKPSRLANAVEKILGRRLTAEEYKNGYDETQLLKRTVEADIVHNQSADGSRTFANVDELYKNGRDTSGIEKVREIAKQMREARRAEDEAASKEGTDEVPF